MGYLPVTVSTGETAEMHDLIERSTARFTQLNGREVFVIRDEHVQDSARAAALPTLAVTKLLIWDIVPETVNTVLYFDRDILPVAPLGELPDCTFAAVADRPIGLAAAKRHWPFFKKSDFYFNAGLFLATRDTKPILDMVYHLQSYDKDCLGCHDQTLLNIVAQSQAQVTELPVEYNFPIADAQVPCDHPRMVHCFGTYRKYTLLRYLLDELEAAGV